MIGPHPDGFPCAQTNAQWFLQLHVAGCSAAELQDVNDRLHSVFGIHPSYIGRAAVYLASDYFSQFTTGSTVTVDAGLLARPQHR